MSHEIASLLDTVRVGTPVAVDGVTFYPLLKTGNGSPKVLLLEDAITRNLLEVRETGVVAELEVVNKGEERVLVLEGDIVAGGRQNRVMNTSCVIAAKATVKVPTSCVEQGRWAGAGRRFTSSGHSVSPGVKSKLKRSVGGNTIGSGGACRKSEQGEVWSETSSTLAGNGASSPSSDHLAAYEARAKELDGKVDAVVRDLGEAVGVAVTRGDGRAGVEVFGSPEIAEKVLPRIVRSHLLAPAMGESRQAPAAMLADVTSAKETRVGGAAGVGEELRIAKKKMSGLAFVLDGAALHVSADWET